jgi:hypothetical protein
MVEIINQPICLHTHSHQTASLTAKMFFHPLIVLLIWKRPVLNYRLFRRASIRRFLQGDLSQYDCHDGCRPLWQTGTRGIQNSVDGRSQLEGEFFSICVVLQQQIRFHLLKYTQIFIWYYRKISMISVCLQTV